MLRILSPCTASVCNDHNCFLQNCACIESDPSLSWFESYLSGRQQFVSIDGQRSDSLLIKQGVPQGSVSGPALFLLFVNDIPLHLTNSTVDIYADDTTITASAHFSDLCSTI